MFLPLIACAAVLAWVWLLFAHGGFWRILLPQQPRLTPAEWPEVAIIVPARDEVAMIPQTLPALLALDYPGVWRIILVDDHSTDGTAAAALQIASRHSEEGRLTVIQAPALPPGWSGKVHALHTGLEAAGHPAFVLFTDADILHQPGSLRYLVARALESGLDLHSLMVKLHCKNLWEKFLIPAFVYFFQLLYPFAWSNDPARSTAAAAGGVMLVRNQALQEIGGLAAIRDAIIDDCALAKAIKSRAKAQSGQRARILLTLVDFEVVSLRAYPHIGVLWRMIRRAAYTQLRYSPLLLIGAVAGMLLLFATPFYISLQGDLYALAGWLIFVAMIYSYLPMVEFYRLNILWAAALPFAALVYTGATLDSARLTWQGAGGQWKGRAQAVRPPA